MAILFLVLHHIIEPVRVIAQARRALRPGGRLLVVDMMPHDREEYRKDMGHAWQGFSNQTLSAWLTEADLDFYTAEFERTGLRGGLNRYRNMDRDWEELPELANAKIQQPVLFLAGDKDPVIRMSQPEGMKAHIPNLELPALLPNCGHWTQQEKPAEVNAALIKFLKAL